MACKCLEENQKMCEEALKNHTDKLAYGCVEGSSKVSIVGKMWVISEGDHSPLAICVKSEFRGNKKDGSPRANLTKLENMLRIKFCPFCGTEFTGK